MLRTTLAATALAVLLTSPAAAQTAPSAGDQATHFECASGYLVLMINTEESPAVSDDYGKRVVETLARANPAPTDAEADAAVDKIQGRARQRALGFQGADRASVVSFFNEVRACDGRYRYAMTPSPAL